LEPFKLNMRSLSVLPALRACFSGRPARIRRSIAVIALSAAALVMTACTHNLYQFPLYTFGGRPIPPSQLGQRVMVGVTYNGTTGALVILDGFRDLRNNLANTISGYAISGFSGGYPNNIINFPEQQRGYVYSDAPPYSFGAVNYSSESASGAGGSFGGRSPSIATAPDGLRVVAAIPGNGQLVVIDNQTGATYALNLPNAYKVSVNTGDTVILATVRDSNALYRVIKLNNTPNTVAPPGAIDCQPNILPVYCVVPVPGNFDRPYGAAFALDGSSAYVLNCGAECGGGSNGGAGISVIPQSALQINQYPTATPYPAVVTNTVPVPGGVTVATSDATYLYVAGQQLQASSGLFTGNLSMIPLATIATSKTPIQPSASISDGLHTRLLFADDNTLWIGSQFCATGVRHATGQNYNCLTRVVLNGTTSPTAAIVPAVNPTSSPVVTVPYPNTDQNLYYYGSLTGICWVQNYHKVYTAYGGQVHAFNTADGSEINNINITVQGTALDVAYMDALTNEAN
jgi:hypothetical protein